MKKLWFSGKFFKLEIGIILLLLILFLLLQLSAILNVIFAFVFALLSPVLIAGLFYYLLRPIRRLIEGPKISRLAAIIIIYVFLILGFTIAIFYFWPYLKMQIDEFAATPQEKIQEVKSFTLNFLNLFNFSLFSYEEMSQNLTDYLAELKKFVANDLLATIASITKITTFFVITPFVLFYFLKDDYKFMDNVLKMVPDRYGSKVKRILHGVDGTLSSYINSQVIVSIVVASLLYIGYILIGLPYALLLSVFALIFNLIPFLGPFIATIPALLIGLTISPSFGLKVIAVVLVVHFFDLNLISPKIVGKRLNIHPITIILLLVASGSLNGILGLFIITPLYAVIKTIVLELYNSNGAVSETEEFGG